METHLLKNIRLKVL